MTDLLTAPQIAQHFARIFGVSQRTVRERWMRSPDFPEPDIVVPGSRQRAWKREKIESYGKQQEAA